MAAESSQNYTQSWLATDMQESLPLPAVHPLIPVQRLTIGSTLAITYLNWMEAGRYDNFELVLPTRVPA